MVSLPFSKDKKKTRPEGSSMPGPPPASGGRNLPVMEIQAMSSRGVPEPRMIQTLQNEGYSPTEIDQAMKQVLKSRVSQGPPGQPQSYAGQHGMNPPQPGSADQQGIPSDRNFGDIPHPPRSDEKYRPQPFNSPIQSLGGQPPQRGMEDEDLYQPRPFQHRPPSAPSGDRMPPSQPHGKSMSKDDIEELTEVLVEEKINRFSERFKAVDNRIRQMEARIQGMEGEMQKIRSERADITKDIETKIDTYKENMTTINSRMESMEKALKDSLSPMLESLRSLSDTIKTLKKEKS